MENKSQITHPGSGGGAEGNQRRLEELTKSWSWAGVFTSWLPSQSCLEPAKHVSVAPRLAALLQHPAAAAGCASNGTKMTFPGVGEEGGGRFELNQFPPAAAEDGEMTARSFCQALESLYAQAPSSCVGAGT